MRELVVATQARTLTVQIQLANTTSELRSMRLKQQELEVKLQQLQIGAKHLKVKKVTIHVF